MKKYNEHSIIKPIDMFPKWVEHINRELPIWNFAEEKFYKEINVYIFIVSALTKWITEDIAEYWVNYFWKETILDAFEFYKDRVSRRYRNIVKDILEKLD